LDDSRLDYTLVFQVDEFWSRKKKSLADLSQYWHTIVAGRRKRAAEETDKEPDGYEKWKSAHWDRKEDIYGHFQPHATAESYLNGQVASCGSVPAIASNQVGQDTLSRKDMFLHAEGRRQNAAEEIDRIPYLWDFGFLIADWDLWSAHAHRKIERAKDLYVGD